MSGADLSGILSAVADATASSSSDTMAGLGVESADAGPSSSSSAGPSHGITVLPIPGGAGGDGPVGGRGDSTMMAIDGSDLASLLGVGGSGGGSGSGGASMVDALMGGVGVEGGSSLLGASGSGPRDAVQTEPAVQREIEKAEREGKADEKSKANDDEEKELARVYENFDFDPLWSRLSEALTRMKGDPNAAQILLPLIEVSLVAFAVCDLWRTHKSFCRVSWSCQNMLQLPSLRHQPHHHRCEAPCRP